MTYLVLKAAHLGSVGLSLGGFLARGLLMLADSPLLALRWLKGIHEPPEENNPHRCAARKEGRI